MTLSGREWSARELGRRLFVAGRVLALAYVLWTGTLFALQRRMLFPGRGWPAGHEDHALPPAVEPLWVDTSFGRVEAWLLRAPDAAAPRPAIVFAHGNGESIDTWDGPMLDVARAGVHVLLVEFPGYGHSDGAPTRATLAETFDAALDRLAAMPEVDSARLVAWGRSLGGGPAGDLARGGRVRALILQSTFSSLAAMAWESYRAPGFLVRDRWDNAAVVREFRGPVLLMHGRTDDVIPFSHVLAVAEARDGIEPVEIPCAHNDCGRVWPAILDQVLGFLTAEGVVEAAPIPTAPSGRG